MNHTINQQRILSIGAHKPQPRYTVPAWVWVGLIAVLLVI